MTAAEPRFVAVNEVRLPSTAVDAVAAVIRSGYLAQGEQVARFENAFAEMHGTRHAVAVHSGSAALVAALTALGIGRGDEVVTTPFTFVATVNAILAVGATPKFADIRTDDFALDPEAVEAAITPRTAAVLVVHLFGQCADMVRLTAIAARHGVALVEDAAQAHGASVGATSAGAFGTGCFSFYATKNLTTGEGGMVTTSDDGVARRLRLLRNHGMTDRYRYEQFGHNWRMTDLAAAMGLAQLPGYTEVVDARARHAELFCDELRDVEQLHLPQRLDGRRHVWHQFTIRVKGVGRDRFVERLAMHRVGCAVHYPVVLVDLPHIAAVAARGDSVPEARRCAEDVVSLPVHQHLSDDDVGRVVRAARDAARPCTE